MFGRYLRKRHEEKHREFIRKFLGGYLTPDEDEIFKKIFYRCRFCREEVRNLKELSDAIEKSGDIPEIDDDFYKKAVESLYFVEHRSNFKKRLENFLKDVEKRGMKHAVKFAFYSFLVVILVAVPLFLNIYNSFKGGKTVTAKNFTISKTISGEKKSDDLIKIIYMTNYVAGNVSTISSQEEKKLDVNGDGKINSVDLTFMIHREIGDIGK